MFDLFTNEHWLCLKVCKAFPFVIRCILALHRSNNITSSVRGSALISCFGCIGLPVDKAANCCALSFRSPGKLRFPGALFFTCNYFRLEQVDFISALVLVSIFLCYALYQDVKRILRIYTLIRDI